MQRSFIFTSLASAIAIAAAAPASAGTCPALGASSDCGYLITIDANGIVSGAPTGIGPYDGSEDTLVGVINNSPNALNSLTLSGSNIFGFEGDGEAYYTGIAYGPTGYEGPNTLFDIVDYDNGTVNFTGGLAGNGGTAWFTLEENLASISGGVQVTVGGVPEPSTWAMMLLGFGAIGAAVRTRKKRQLVTI